jgi:hypothetical protein
VSKTINQLLHFFAAGDYFAKFGEKIVKSILL